MPLFAYIEVVPYCPHCGINLSGLYKHTTFKIQFTWGYCPYRYAGPENTYHVGDAIRWRTCPNGSIIPFAYFKQSNSANVGNPTENHIFVTDDASETNLQNVLCPNCKSCFGGCVVEIENNIIVRCWVYLLGTFVSGNIYFRLDKDGLYQPIQELERVYETLVNDDCSLVY